MFMVKVAQSRPTLCEPMDYAVHGTPEYWSGQPFPSLGDLSNPGIKPRSPALQADSLPAEPQAKPNVNWMGIILKVELCTLSDTVG